jgi:hypothetical protein
VRVQVVARGLGSADWYILQQRQRQQQFIMRGRAALIDPGLNVLMTQSQYQDTIYHMAKTLTVNRYKASRLWIYVVFSVPVWFLVHLCKSLLYCLQSSNRTDQPSYEQTKKILDRSTEPVQQLRFALRKTRSATSIINNKHGIPPWLIDIGFLIVWSFYAYTVFAVVYLSYHDLPLTGVHAIEPQIAIVYFLWGALLLAVQSCIEVEELPSDTPFKLAFMKAELATTQLSLTKIVDGRPTPCSGVSFLFVCCQLSRGEQVSTSDVQDSINLYHGLLQQYVLRPIGLHSIPA